MDKASSLDSIRGDAFYNEIEKLAAAKDNVAKRLSRIIGDGFRQMHFMAVEHPVATAAAIGGVIGGSTAAVPFKTKIRKRRFEDKEDYEDRLQAAAEKNRAAYWRTLPVRIIGGAAAGAYTGAGVGGMLTI